MDINLQEFCSTDDMRESIQKPFNQNGFTYATDGRVAVRVAQMELPEQHPKPPVMESVMKMYCSDSETGWERLLTPEQPEFEECDSCCGTTRCECSCGNVHQCESCDDAGNNKNIKPVKIGTRMFAAHYLHKVSRLPNVEFQTNTLDPKKPMSFRFDGGIGLLMPIANKD